MKRILLLTATLLLSYSLYSQINLNISSTDPSCFGVGDGTAGVSPSGGLPPYSVNWSGALSGLTSTSNNLSGLYPDTYNVTVTDQNNDVATGSVTLATPPQIEIWNMDLFDPDPCDSSFCIEAQLVMNGLQVISAVWTPTAGGETSLPNSLYLCEVQPNTNYQLELMDDNGCTVSSQYMTPNFGPFSIATTSTDVNCSVGGTAAASASFAGQPVFQWSNGSTGPNISGLVAGTYYVTVTAGFGNCTLVDSAVVGTSSNFSVNILEVPDPCQGTVCLTTTLPPNTAYTWSTGDVTPQICVNTSGTYTLTVTSGFGCTATSSITTTMPPLAMSLSMSSTPASCGNDGSVTVNPQNGSAPYIYLWNTSDTQQTLNNMPAGNYRVTVTDANGCMAIDSVSIGNGSFQLDSVNVVGETCSSSSDGAVQVYVTGSNPPFSYMWSNGDTTEQTTGLAVGTYILTVTDAGGCFLIQTINVPLERLHVDIENTTYADCVTGEEGILLAVPQNGTAPYTYRWSSGSIADTAMSLNVGGHTVTVTDANGCGTIAHGFVDADPSCFATLSGVVYLDSDSGCSLNTGDFGLNGAIVSIDPGYTAITDANGNWAANVLHGTNYRVYLNNSSNLLFDACNIDTLPVSVPDSNAIQGLDLPKNSTGEVDVELNLSCGVARAGFINYTHVTVSNNSFTTVSVSGSVVLDTIYTTIDTGYVTPGFVIDSISTTLPIVIHFTCPNVPPQGSIINAFKTAVPAIPTVSLGQWTYASGAISLNGLPETNLTNNATGCWVEITGAYDPNDKQVFSEGLSVDGVATTEDTLLHYKVRFQNTGTDTAFNIVIRDTLDADLDVTSFRLLASSHHVEVEFHEERIVHFVYNNILLPDSNVNEPLSHGFVEYSLRVDHPELLEEITNMAAIYFDFNPPIFTNTVSTQRQIIESVVEVEVEVPVNVFPNPTSGNLYVNLGGMQVNKVELYDMMGRMQLEQRYQAIPQAELDVNGLPNGIYLLRIQSGTQWFTDRVMVSK